MQAAALKYHHAIFDLLDRTPVISKRAQTIIKQWEKTCGVEFPASVKEYFSTEDYYALFDEQTIHYLTPLKELGNPKEEAAQGYLHLATENSGVVRWYIRLDGSDDPAVYDDDDQYCYKEISLLVGVGCLFLLLACFGWGQPRVDLSIERWSKCINGLSEPTDLFYARVYQRLKERLTQASLPDSKIGIGPGHLFGNGTIFGRGLATSSSATPTWWFTSTVFHCPPACLSPIGAFPSSLSGCNIPCCSISLFSAPNRLPFTGSM